MPEAVDRYRTGEDGGYLLVAPGPGMWRVVLEAPGRVPVERRLVPLFEDATLPTVQLPVDVRSSVTVVDTEGRPVPDARVTGALARTSPMDRMLSGTGWRRHGVAATTGPTGRFHLPRAENEILEVRAWAPAFLPAEVTGGGDGEPLTLRLPAGRERLLRVSDPAGQALPDVMVQLATAGVTLGITDVEGRLAAVLPDAAPVDLVLDAGGGWRQGVTLDPASSDPQEAAPPADGPLEVTLPAPVLLTGTVVDAEGGGPLAGALVWPRGEPGAAVKTDGEGAYEMIAGSPPEEVSGAAAGHRVAAVRPADAGAGRVPELRLPPAVVLAGTLSDAAGQPVPGARIRLRTPAHPGLTWEGGFGGEVAGATSDGQGRFRAVGLDAGSVYLLRVEAPGFSTLEQPVEPPARLALELARGGGLTGRVTDPYAAPVAGARVRLFAAPEEADTLVLQVRDGEQLADHETHTDAEGGFVLDTVGTGVYDLRIDADGLAPLRRTGVEVPRGELLDLGRLVAEPAVAVAGRVVDGAGEPVAGARVSVDPFSPYRGWRGSRSVYTFSSGSSRASTQVGGVVTDGEGRFRLGGLGVRQAEAAPQLHVRPLVGRRQPAQALLGGHQDAARLVGLVAALDLPPHQLPAGEVGEEAGVEAGEDLAGAAAVVAAGVRSRRRGEGAEPVLDHQDAGVAAAEVDLEEAEALGAQGAGERLQGELQLHLPQRLAVLALDQPFHPVQVAAGPGAADAPQLPGPALPPAPFEQALQGEPEVGAAGHHPLAGGVDQGAPGRFGGELRGQCQGALPAPVHGHDDLPLQRRADEADEDLLAAVAEAELELEAHGGRRVVVVDELLEAPLELLHLGAGGDVAEEVPAEDVLGVPACQVRFIPVVLAHRAVQGEGDVAEGEGVDVRRRHVGKIVDHRSVSMCSSAACSSAVSASRPRSL